MLAFRTAMHATRVSLEHTQTNASLCNINLAWFLNEHPGCRRRSIRDPWTRLLIHIHASLSMAFSTWSIDSRKAAFAAAFAVEQTGRDY